MTKQLREEYYKLKQIRQLNKDFERTNAIFFRKQAEKLVEIQKYDSLAHGCKDSGDEIGFTDNMQRKSQSIQELSELRQIRRDYQSTYFKELAILNK